MKNKVILFLGIILLIGFFLRVFKLGTNPPSLTWDEVAWGYNAYSLGIDGKDEFGRFLPIDYLESFGDFKPPVYAYLDIIPVKVLGLNEFATRFPSALFGTLTILMTFFLTKRILERKNKEVEMIALLAAGILAISPWHIMLSRAAFEANVATFFLVTGIWAFLAGVQEKKWYLIISAISFTFSMYTFNTSRVFAPLIVLVLVFAFRKKLFKIKTQVIVAGLIGMFMIIPIVPFLLSPQASLRFKEVNIFSDASVVTTANQEIANDNNALWSKLIHNRRVLYAQDFISHYFDNLSPSFLFIKGDGNPKFSIQSVGQLYIWESVFLIGGFLLLFRKREGNWWIIPVWVLLGIIPAATARETPHALRIETIIPTFQIVTAYGIYYMCKAALSWHPSILKKKLGIGKVFIGLVVLIASLNFLYFIHDYFVHYPVDWSTEWQYGYKDSINYARSVADKYDYIEVTNGLGRPYIYYLFYNKVDPTDFRKSAKVSRDAFGFVKVEGFGKYKFPENLDYSLNQKSRVLYIGMANNLPKGAHVLKRFNLLNGMPILAAYTI